MDNINEPPPAPVTDDQLDVALATIELDVIAEGEAPGELDLPQQWRAWEAMAR